MRPHGGTPLLIRAYVGASAFALAILAGPAAALAQDLTSGGNRSRIFNPGRLREPGYLSEIGGFQRVNTNPILRMYTARARGAPVSAMSLGGESLINRAGGGLRNPLSSQSMLDGGLTRLRQLSTVGLDARLGSLVTQDSGIGGSALPRARGTMGRAAGAARGFGQIGGARFGDPGGAMMYAPSPGDYGLYAGRLHLSEGRIATRLLALSSRRASGSFMRPDLTQVAVSEEEPAPPSGGTEVAAPDGTPVEPPKRSLEDVIRDRLRRQFESYIRRAELSFRAGDYQAAGEAFRLADAVQPMHPVSQRGMLFAAIATERYATATAALASILKSRPELLAEKFDVRGLYPRPEDFDRQAVALRQLAQMSGDASVTALAAYVTWVGGNTDEGRRLALAAAAMPNVAPDSVAARLAAVYRQANVDRPATSP